MTIHRCPHCGNTLPADTLARAQHYRDTGDVDTPSPNACRELFRLRQRSTTPAA